MRALTQSIGTLSVAELADLMGQTIVREGGESRDSVGVRIYSRRFDVRIPIDAFDPAEGRAVRVMAKIRVTVEREG